jgi:hypothetical protein
MVYLYTNGGHVLAVIEPGTISPSSGGVVLFSDVAFSAADALVLNAIVYSRK